MAHCFVTVSIFLRVLMVLACVDTCEACSANAKSNPVRDQVSDEPRPAPTPRKPASQYPDAKPPGTCEPGNPFYCQRKRRSITVSVDAIRHSARRRENNTMSSSCNCNGKCSLNNINITTLQRMDGKMFSIDVQKYLDPNNSPVYDVLQLTSHANGNETEEHIALPTDKYFFSTMTNECDCTDTLHVGRLFIRGEVVGDQLVRVSMSNFNAVDEDEFDMVIVVVALGVVLSICSSAVVVVLLRRRISRKVRSGASFAGAGITACEVKEGTVGIIDRYRY